VCDSAVNNGCAPAAASNKQGDVELVSFGLDGSNNLVIYVSICCDHIGRLAQSTTDTSTARSCRHVYVL